MDKNFRSIIMALITICFLTLQGCAAIPELMPTANQEIVHTVKSGEDLGGIARRYTGSVNNADAIARHNSIRNKNRIYAGQQIIIPAHLAGGSSSGSLGSGFTGPATTSRTVQEGTVVGGAVGAGVGVAVCRNKSGMERVLCMMAATFAGAGVGYVAGQEIDRRQRNYASTEAFYDGQIRETAALNRELSQTNRDLQRSVQADQRRIDALVAQHRTGRATRASLVQSHNDVRTKHQENSQILDELKSELEVQQGVMAQAREQGETRRANSLQQQINQLEREINTLQSTVNQLASQEALLGGYI